MARAMHLRLSKGVSIIEFMIAVVIGSVISLAAFEMVVQFEDRKRAITTSSESDLTAMYVLSLMDTDIRSAGSAYTGGARVVSGDLASSYQYFYGCNLNVSSGGTQVLPRQSAFPAPFASVPQRVRLAPVIIVDGGVNAEGESASDVLMLAGGGGSRIESVQTLPQAPEAGSLVVDSGIGVLADDLLLLTPADVTGDELSGSDCVVTQVADDHVTQAVKNLNVDLAQGAGQYHNPEGFGINALSVWTNLGASMRHYLYGVDATGALEAYNLQGIEQAGINPEVVADNVLSLQAVYGVDSGAGVVWTPPTGDYSTASLLDGTQAATERLISIKAIGLAVVVQATENSRETVSGDDVTVFSTLGADVLIDLPEQNKRYTVMESIIPIRNVISLGAG